MNQDLAWERSEPPPRFGGVLSHVIEPMTKPPQIFWTYLMAGFLFMATGCGTMTTMKLSGTPGAPFVGQYTRNGHDIEITGTLPKTFKAREVSACEFRKLNPQDTLVLEATDGRSILKAPASAGAVGVRADFEEGWSFRRF